MPSKLTWDGAGEKKFELGVNHGVLYTKNSLGAWVGVAWNGLISVTESPEGAESNDIYADNIKYGSFLSAENLKATIEAYTYPDAFNACDGSKEMVYTPSQEGSTPVGGVYAGQQNREAFCLCYETGIGDETSQNKGSKLHILYNCKASPSERAYETLNDSPEAITFSWEVSCTPAGVGSTLEDDGFKATAEVVIDSTKCPAAKWNKIINKLHGSTTADATVLMPEEIYEILAEPEN